MLNTPVNVADVPTRALTRPEVPTAERHIGLLGGRTHPPGRGPALVVVANPHADAAARATLRDLVAVVVTRIAICALTRPEMVTAEGRIDDLLRRALCLRRRRRSPGVQEARDIPAAQDAPERGRVIGPVLVERADAIAAQRRDDGDMPRRPVPIAFG